MSRSTGSTSIISTSLFCNVTQYWVHFDHIHITVLQCHAVLGPLRSYPHHCSAVSRSTGSTSIISTSLFCNVTQYWVHFDYIHITVLQCHAVLGPLRSYPHHCSAVSRSTGSTSIISTSLFCNVTQYWVHFDHIHITVPQCHAVLGNAAKKITISDHCHLEGGEMDDFIFICACNSSQK